MPFPAQMALTSHLGAVCGDQHGLGLASETESPAHVHLPQSGLWLSWGQILDHGYLTGMSPSPPPGTAGLGGAAALEPCGDMEHVCALRKRPGGGTGLPHLLGDPHVATGRTDVWELRLERFPSLGSHRPCCDAGELGGDVAALGAFLVTPRSQDAPTWNGSRAASEPLEESPPSRALRRRAGGGAQITRVPRPRRGTRDAPNKAVPLRDRVGGCAAAPHAGSPGRACREKPRPSPRHPAWFSRRTRGRQLSGPRSQPLPARSPQGGPGPPRPPRASGPEQGHSTVSALGSPVTPTAGRQAQRVLPLGASCQPQLAQLRDPGGHVAPPAGPGAHPHGRGGPEGPAPGPGTRGCRALGPTWRGWHGASAAVPASPLE